MGAPKIAECVLAFDIGGSFIRAARFDSQSDRPLSFARRNTPNFLSSATRTGEQLLDEVFARVFELGSHVLEGDAADAVVVAYPGPMTAHGVALRSPTILGDELDRPYDVSAALRRLWPNAQTAVLNDVTCAGYSYVARGHQDFAVVTVGSGIGNKVFLGGQPLVGPNGRGGEIGHLVVHPSVNSPVGALFDELGNIASGRGVLEVARQWALAEPRALASSALAGNSEIDSAALVRAFEADDPLTLRIVAAASEPLALAIGTLHLALGLEAFFIAGGFAKALGPKYLQVLIAHLRRVTWDLGQDWSSLLALGSDDSEEALLGAGFLGARLLSQAKDGGCQWLPRHRRN